MNRMKAEKRNGFTFLPLPLAAVFRAGDVTAYRSMCQMHTLLHAADTHRIGHQSVTLGH